MRAHFDAAKIVVVGHSMGGRVAAHLSASGDVGAVVALATMVAARRRRPVP
jgi:dienelactone hydrolase